VNLNAKQLRSISAALRTRRDELAPRLRRSVARTRDESYVALARDGTDSGDFAVAASVAEVGSAEVDRQLGELRQLEDALTRIADGSYGRCMECGVDIASERLRAQPAAMRCIDCQSVYERTHAHPRARRL